MGNQRKTGGRSELDSLWTQVNALITDLTSARAKVVALVTDVGVLRTPIVALRADLTAVRTKLLAAGADLLVLRAQAVNVIGDVATIIARRNVALGLANIANATNAGKLKTQLPCAFTIGGKIYNLSNTDNYWSLVAEVNTTADKHRAYWLLVDAAGNASIAAGADSADANAAIAALPAMDPAKAVFGVYVAGPSTDFDAAGGLSGQGTIHHGFASAQSQASSSPAALTYADPAELTSADPAAISATNPAAMSSSATTLIPA